MTPSSRLGHCPSCETVIPERRMLIRYRSSQGVRLFAECPKCEDVVHPQS